MAETEQLELSDQTPHKVLDGMALAHKPYKQDDCITCGAVIKMGFFFDGFGRNRDQDDPATSRYSNICRLWEAHRDNDDRRRDRMPNQFWYPFYYSGLGTPLNKDAENNEIVSAATKAGHAVGKSTAAKITGVDKLTDLKEAPGKATKKAVLKALDEMSLRPVAQVFSDLAEQAEAVPKKMYRVLSMAQGDRWVRRGKAAVRAALYDIKKNPLKAGWSLVNGVFRDVAMDAIPMFRDHAAVASVLGTGVEDRLNAALKQFKAAYKDAKAQMSKVQRIEVSVFGADRGGVLARVFVNELVRRYKRRNDLDLRIGGNAGEKGDPIEIRFLGLLDAVSSIMEENKLLDLLPVVSMIKQNHGDRPLGVPAAVQRCVHFAAAHELRFYQRLDSLEKTRGDQYLYPGTSEDIAGGAVPGSTAFRGELQRVALRDLLHEALMAGAAVDMMEDLAEFKPDTFRKFSLAHPVKDGQTAYKIPDLIKAYRAIVPRKTGLDFLAHMKVFIRWLAERYQSPAFRALVKSPLEARKHAHDVIVRQRKHAEAAYQQERSRTPIDPVALGRAQARMVAARAAEMESLRSVGEAVANPAPNVWERISEEAAEITRRKAWQDSLKASADRLRKSGRGGEMPYDFDPEYSAQVVEDAMLSPEAMALVEVWQDGISGRNPLPAEVMALFDLLVHDSMLTSWHDHILSSTLYFQTRAVDTFGSTDEQEEAKARADDEARAKRAEQMPKMGLPAHYPR